MNQPQIIQKPVVAIVGRTNVGKSTLFNRLIEESKALISSIPGTTRAPNYGEVIWRGRVFTVVDTGGLEKRTIDPFTQAISRQATAVTKDAALVLFLVDARVGITPHERELAKMLRTAKQPVVLVANKSERASDRATLARGGLRALGLAEPFLISAATGMGVGDLLDAALKKLDEKGMPAPTITEALAPISVAIVGKPNVGKSSLLNRLVGAERALVSEIAHTTREPQDTLVRIGDSIFLFIDTAGVRKQMKQRPGLEAEGVRKTLVALKRADVVLFVVDVTDADTAQDRHLAGIVTKSGKGVMMVVNKWDLVPHKETGTQNTVRDALGRAFPFISWASMHFVSAKTGMRVATLYDEILRVAEARKRTVDAKELESFLRETLARHRPPKRRGMPPPHIYSLKQIGTEPPTFELAAREIQVGADRVTIQGPYLRYIENQIRSHWDFSGTSICMQIKPIRRK